MVEADKKRFMELLRWLAKRYPVDGIPRTLPKGEDLAEYYAALRDVPIEDLEGGSRWHYGHSEFFPDRPASLRRSAAEWRKENPRPYQPPEPVRKVLAVQETPESREVSSKALAELLDGLNGRGPVPWRIEDLVGTA